MIINRKIVFNILFSSAILFCFGLNSYSIFNVQHCIIEVSAQTSGAGSSFIQDGDSFNDDQILHPDKLSSPVELKDQMLPSGKCHSVLEFYTSFWQPPKNS
jgi:hypothetical protein